MDQNVPRTRLFWVAGAYAAVVALSAALIFERYIAYVRHPDDAAAYSGMWAGGDLLLEVFISGMLLVVSFFLVIAIFKYEAAYTTYSKILVALSLTAPASVGLMAIPAVGQSNSVLGYVCLYRVFASPLVLLGLGMSRLFARFPKPKRMTNYALLIEALTLVFMVLMVDAVVMDPDGVYDPGIINDRLLLGFTAVRLSCKVLAASSSCAIS